MTAPRFVDGLEAFAERYTGFIVDQWGVLHDGARPYPGAVEALMELKRRNKRVVLLTNSGRRAATNEERLKQLGFNTGLLDGIVTSGEATWLALRDRTLPPFDRLGRRCHLVTSGDDRGPVEGLDLEVVREVDEADFVYFTFLQAALDEVDRYDPMLERARARSLPFICSNPDRVAVNAGGLTAAPGSVAARYAAMGGEVVYVGKPHRPIYAACLDVLEELEPAEIVCIGDSTEHDIKGANDMNLAACFVECGIHAEHFPEGASRAGKVHALDLLCAEHECLPDYVIPRFRW